MRCIHSRIVSQRHWVRIDYNFAFLSVKVDEVERGGDLLEINHWCIPDDRFDWIDSLNAQHSRNWLCIAIYLERNVIFNFTVKVRYCFFFSNIGLEQKFTNSFNKLCLNMWFPFTRNWNLWHICISWHFNTFFSMEFVCRLWILNICTL